MRTNRIIAFLCAVSLLALAACNKHSTDPAPTQGVSPTEGVTVPVEGLTNPTQIPTNPTGSTQTPTDGMQDPTVGTESPTVSPADPTEGTQTQTIPTESTQIPTNPTAGTQAPTANPVDPTEGTQVPTASPVAPTEGTQVPTANPIAPTEGTQMPTSSPVAPTEGTQMPTASSVAPTEGTQMPTAEPTSPTEATLAPTIKPISPTQPTEMPLPPSVTIPPATDPEDGEPEPITFPCPVPGYGLVIEKIAPYSGMFVEDGTNVSVQNVAMLLLHNNGDYPIEFAQICVEYGQEKLLFDVTALPDGELLVVQEKYGKSIPEGEVSFVSASIVERADMSMSEGKVEVTDNGDNTLTIKNLTGETIPTVRVFYKYYMADENIFVGGIAFTVRVTRLNPGASITIQPSHYTSQTCRVVMVLTYDSEV